ncbi:LexA family protein [Algicola sagamiensis]|uniref:LexA family protein n=1 Tax=Algicola sagamiensis TaxID=163869 RepID=UPI00039BA871|nr:XRE family transcriptional regulator [Algicola sagamiensis]
MQFGHVVRRLRKNKGWTLQRLCDEMGNIIQTGHLSRIERDDLAPNIFIAHAISASLNISLDHILQEANGGPLAEAHTDHYLRVPLVSWAEAGYWIESPSFTLSMEHDCWVILPRDKSIPNCFALEVRGDSMQSPYGVSFPEGSIIFVDPNATPKNKSFVIAIQKDADCASFKQLIIDGSEKYLKPLNPQYPLIKIETEILICGVVFDMVYHLSNQ